MKLILNQEIKEFYPLSKLYFFLVIWRKIRDINNHCLKNLRKNEPLI